MQTYIETWRAHLHSLYGSSTLSYDLLQILGIISEQAREAIQWFCMYPYDNFKKHMCSIIQS